MAKKRSFVRKPSLKKRTAARISPKRFIRHSMGFKVPKGAGILSNPKKWVYNKIYKRTSFDPFKSLGKMFKKFVLGKK